MCPRRHRFPPPPPWQPGWSRLRRLRNGAREGAVGLCRSTRMWCLTPPITMSTIEAERTRGTLENSESESETGTRSKAGTSRTSTMTAFSRADSEFGLDRSSLSTMAAEIASLYEGRSIGRDLMKTYLPVAPASRTSTGRAGTETTTETTDGTTDEATATADEAAMKTRAENVRGSAISYLPAWALPQLLSD